MISLAASPLTTEGTPPRDPGQRPECGGTSSEDAVRVSSEPRGCLEWDLRPWCPCRPCANELAAASVWRHGNGHRRPRGNPPIRLSAAWNAFWYWGVWAVCIIGLGIVLRAALRSKRWARWTTQDILIVAALGVLLEVYDNIIGDQFLKPLLDVIPGADLLQLHDLPYMFLLMVGVALIRKPGCVTAMVFVNFLLAQLLFGSGHGALDWTDGLTQGIFCDLYIVARRGRVYGPGATTWSMVIDGLMIGALRGGPNAFLADWTFDPYLNSIYYTCYQMWSTPGRTRSATASRRRSARRWRCGWRARWCPRWAPGRPAATGPFAEAGAAAAGRVRYRRRPDGLDPAPAAEPAAGEA